MRVRGPDGSGAWWSADGRVGLGHRRLAIIDLSPSGAQPMHTADGGLSITFNGEIYNYRELRRELQAKGYVFRSESDTEVLLHLYADRGASMVQSLRGMFAFALWDQKRGGMLVARDPFGIKPLYYANDGESFRVASEVKALLAGGGVDTSPDAAGHVGFFLLGCVPEPHTLFRGIRALPAGCTVWVDSTGVAPPELQVDVNAVFDPRQVETPPSESPDVAAATAEVGALLRDSIKAHLIADVDVGVFLSAGLDSTTIAALAAEGGGRVRTLTLGFEEYRRTEQDETAVAEQVARQYGCQHTTAWITRDKFRLEFDRLLDRMDQPSVDGVNTYLVAMAAGQAGLKVALSGLGGDELFGGYPSFRDVPRLTRLVSGVPGSRQIGRLIGKVAGPLFARFTSPKYAGILEYGGTIGGSYLLRRALYMPWEVDRQIAPDVAREGLKELAIVDRLNATARLAPTPRLKVSVLEAAWYMRSQLLRDADWAGMSHSIEVRVPFVDWPVWRGMSGIIRRRGILPSKQMMAATPRLMLPGAVLQRAKTGFVVPTREWLIAEYGTAHSQRGLRGWAGFVHQVASVRSGQQMGVKVRELFAGLSQGQAGAGRSRRRELLVTVAGRVSQYNAPSRRQLKQARRILVLQLQQLGDSVVFTPTLRAIRTQFPEAQLDMLVNSVSGALYAKCPHVDRFYHDSGPQGADWSPRQLVPAMRRIREEKYDLVIADVTQRSLRYGMVARATGAPIRAGFDSDGRGFMYNLRLSLPDQMDFVDCNLQLAAALGAPSTNRQLECFYDASDAEHAEALLAGFGDARPLIAIHPVSNWQSKTWFVHRWANLADELVERLGARVVFVGSARERPYIEAVNRDAAHQHGSLAGMTTLAQLGAVFARADLVISTDSGPRHIASAMQRPQVTLMSSFDLPYRWQFGWPTETVLRTDPACSPCFQNFCSHRQCMAEITEEAVLNACVERLQYRKTA